MNRALIALYDFFERHRVLFWVFLVGSFLLLAWGAMQVRFEENVTRFFPDTKDARRTSSVFENLKVKDKIILMFTSRDTVNRVGAGRLIEVGEQYEHRLQEQAGEDLINGIFSRAGEETISGVTDFIYRHLPLFIEEHEYGRLDSLLDAEEIERKMKANYTHLISPAGAVMKDIVMRDPLGIGTSVFMKLRDARPATHYEIYNGNIFSADRNTRLGFVTPRYGSGSTGKNEQLIRTIETLIDEMGREAPDVEISYFGGPSVAVYNARQIKWDTMLTLNIALLIIVVFISLVFRKKTAIPLIIIPVVFGAVFALCWVALLKGAISGIAIGAGAAVFGVALSYSIHVLTHAGHVSSPRQLIEELSYPLTVGSFTTVGAFFGLIFTKSGLLQDFGLFASLALIGTTFFCLVFLPHFLKRSQEQSAGWLLKKIEKLNGYAFDRNKWLIAGILLLTVVCFFTSGRVTFDSDMMHLNYEPDHLKQAETKMYGLFQAEHKTVLFVSTGTSWEEALKAYRLTNTKLKRLLDEGEIDGMAAMESMLISPALQEERIRLWNTFWTPGRKARVRENIQHSGEKYHFRKGAFVPFLESLDRNYTPCDYGSEALRSLKLLEEWVTVADSGVMLVTHVHLQQENKEKVYAHFSGDEQLVIFDRGYFANQWVSAIHDDFYLVLYISSFLIFFALWLSYGRIELTLMTFTPMAISWIIIVGLMGILNIPFNIVSIILSTFIFGLGDDFSIFIMDGLQQEYRTGKKMLSSHKTAIFFSAFTTVVGIGALVFAAHPALQSISMISIVGMLAVVLVAYTIQPVLFRLFISGPVEKGGFPYTLSGLGITVWAFLLFVTGCGLLQGIIPLLLLLPVSGKQKKWYYHRMICGSLRGFMKLMFNVKQEYRNQLAEHFDTPAVVIANHQSFVDILVLLSLSPKFVMVTNNWVWKSPFFGRIVRFGDCYNTSGGYEKLVEVLRKKVEDGYSVVVFPEGTHSADCRLKRFHKGAFYLAEQLQLDIVPVLLYGNGMVVSKTQPFYVKTGTIASEILPRIKREDLAWGISYQERQKKIAAYFRREYDRFCKEFATTDNPYFRNKLIKNYIYKGPVEEWYVRVKLKMEDYYAFFAQMVPAKARITDIGCGLGMLDYMLVMLSDDRRVLGIDYDEDKIAVASHCFARNGHISFVCADALNYAMPDSDVFIFSDMLHYLDYAGQEQLLLHCASHLQEQGMLIIRDGDSGRRNKHALTRLTEFLSIKIFRFNKADRKICFSSREQMQQIAGKCGMTMEILDNDRYTSNTIYILRKKV